MAPSCAAITPGRLGRGLGRLDWRDRRTERTARLTRPGGRLRPERARFLPGPGLVSTAARWAVRTEGGCRDVGVLTAGPLRPREPDCSIATESIIVLTPSMARAGKFPVTASMVRCSTSSTMGERPPDGACTGGCCREPLWTRLLGGTRGRF